MPRSVPSGRTLKVSSKLSLKSSASTHGAPSGTGHPCVKHFFRVVKARAGRGRQSSQPEEQQHEKQRDEQGEHSGLTDSWAAAAHHPQDQHTLSGGCTLSAATGLTVEGGAGLLSFTHGVSAGRGGNAAAHHFAEDDDDYLDDADSHPICSRSAAPKAAQPAAAAAAACLPARPPATLQSEQPGQGGAPAIQLQHPTAVLPEHTTARSGVSITSGAGAASDAASKDSHTQQQALRDSRLSSLSQQHLHVQPAPSSATAPAPPPRFFGYGSLLLHPSAATPHPTTAHTAAHTTAHTQPPPSCSHNSLLLPSPAAIPDPTESAVDAALLPAAHATSSEAEAAAAAPAPAAEVAHAQAAAAAEKGPRARAASSHAQQVHAGEADTLPNAEEGVSVPGPYIIPNYVPKRLPDFDEPEE